MPNSTTPKPLKAADFASDQPVRWCPGCGDYAILNAVKKALVAAGQPKENIAFISGIGCSSRFPYYLDTYGMHGIHGRAPAIASGLKIHKPNLSVWVITGDGDGLAIGGNHFIHAIRRNMDFNLLIFNNQIYGLTKGQYSPTSKRGSKTKTSPAGTLENPFSAARLAIGAGATFFARTAATDPKHLQETLLRADAHQGTSVVEIMQNCLIFNDNAFDEWLDKPIRDDKSIKLQHQQLIVFGSDHDKSLTFQEGKLIIQTGTENAIRHDEENINLAFMLAQLEDIMPLGVLHCREAPSFSHVLSTQVDQVRGESSATVADLLREGEIWEVIQNTKD